MKVLCTIGFFVLFIASSEAATCQYETIDNLYTCILTEGTGSSITPQPPSTPTVQRVIANVSITAALVDPLLRQFNTLQKLEITKGDIRNGGGITFDSFTVCSSLTDLQISSSLQSLPSSGLTSCTGLQNIDFSLNQLTTPPFTNVFAFITSLKSLNLARNQIAISSTTSLTSTIFDTSTPISSLTSLNMSSNQITVFPSAFKLPSATLKKVDFSFNTFSEIAPSILQASLEEVYLNNNQMTTISQNQFQTLTALKVLNIGSNKIMSLNANAFAANTNLESLNISDNTITTLDRTLLTPLTKLKTLDLSKIAITNTSVESLKAVLVAMPDLNSFNISSNKIGPIDGIFSGIAKLKEFYVNDMGLQTLSENMFYNLTSLESVAMNSNGFTYFPDNLFQRPTSLKALRARDNKVTQLKASTFAKLINLEYLDLSGNQIEGIQRGFFDPLTKLKVIKMSGGNKCLTTDIVNFNKDTMLAQFENCFNGYNGAGTLLISHLLLVAVVLLKFA